jgi:DNA adenine methylase
MKNPAIRYHGGKFRLAPWVISHFPEHARYVEPFGGAAGVLLNKKRSYAEIYNDLDGDIVNFFRVLRDPEMRARLTELCILTPFARDEFDLAYQETDDAVERARRTAVRASMGFGSAGATKNHTGFRTDTRRCYGTAQHVWAKYPEALRNVGERFSGVLVENRPAIDVMSAHDGPDTLHYCDPPYVLATRDPRAATESSRYYRHEMSDAQHEEFLTHIKGLQGMVIVSGYATDLYNDHLTGWAREKTMSRMSAGRGTDLREETLWISPAATAQLRKMKQAPLFDA